MAETGFRKWIVTLTVILASLLELIDTTVVNVSLPQIMGNLGATLEDVGWVVTAYAVANVIILPISGWLGARFGRKRYFTFSIILFTVSSFFCGNADNIWELVIFRFLQGNRWRRFAGYFPGDSHGGLAASTDGYGHRIVRIGCSRWSYARPYPRWIHHRPLLLALGVLCQHSAGHYRRTVGADVYPGIEI